MKKIIAILTLVFLVGCAPADKKAGTALEKTLEFISAGDVVKLTNRIYTDKLDSVCKKASTLAGNETNVGTLAGAVKDMLSAPGVQKAQVEILSSDIVDKNMVTFDVRVTAVDILGATALKTIENVNKEIDKPIDVPGYEPIVLETPSMTVPISGPTIDMGLFDFKLPDTQADLGQSLDEAYAGLSGLVNGFAKDAYETLIENAIAQKETDIAAAYTNARQNAYIDINSNQPVPYRVTNTKLTMKKIDGTWRLNIDESLVCALFGFSQTENYGYSMVNGRLMMDSGEHAWEIK